MKISLPKTKVIFFSVVYACIVVFVPWTDFTATGEWVDFDRYVERYNSTGYYLLIYEAKLQSNVIGWITGEVLWDVLMYTSIAVTGDAAISLRILSFFICLVWGLILFRRVPFWWGLLFLLHPLCLSIALSIIRNGFSWVIFLIGFMQTSKIRKWILYSITPLIHTSSLALIGMDEIRKRLINKKDNKYILSIKLILIGVGIALMITVYNELLFALLGDYRLKDDYIVGGGSILQALFWGILLIIQFSCSKEYLFKHRTVIILLVWYLVMNPFIPWAYRIWAIFMPIVAISIWDLPRQKRMIASLIWVGYLAIWIKFYFGL